MQLYQWGWDHHGSNRREDFRYDLPDWARAVDGPIATLVQDLKQRGLLKRTLIIWGGEFGRTPMREGGTYGSHVGRDHDSYAFTISLAGGGVKRGLRYESTDEIGYYPVEHKCSVGDLQATVHHLPGLDPYRISYSFQELNQRLIGPTDAGVVSDILA